MAKTHIPTPAIPYGNENTVLKQSKIEKVGISGDEPFPGVPPALVQIL